MAGDVEVEPFRQAGSGVRFDWGLTAASAVVGGTSALAVVDVLSFTTAVSVATGRDMAIVPFPLDGAGADELALRFGAALAVPRDRTSPEHPWSLSPSALLAAPHTSRLVLPSPNGSAIAAALAAPGTATVAACLRNVTATVGWLLARGYGTDARPVWLIGGGERWADGSLRPALEDLLGAGAVAGGLGRAGCRLSPEARAAASAYAATADLLASIEGCASGRELAARGFSEEAPLAAALDADSHASVWGDGMFVRA